MPVNLSSFCIWSTYDILPSPSNLKKWKLTTKASRFLCNKGKCTTSHIFGASKVALGQRRFNFRHDDVLRIIIKSIRSSFKSIKSTVPTSKQPIKGKIYKNRNQSKKQTIFSHWDITSGIRLGIVKESRWDFFLSTLHSIYRTRARHNYFF